LTLTLTHARTLFTFSSIYQPLSSSVKRRTAPRPACCRASKKFFFELSHEVLCSRTTSSSCDWAGHRQPRKWEQPTKRFVYSTLVDDHRAGSCPTLICSVSCPLFFQSLDLPVRSDTSPPTAVSTARLAAARVGLLARPCRHSNVSVIVFKTRQGSTDTCGPSPPCAPKNFFF